MVTNKMKHPLQHLKDINFNFFWKYNFFIPLLLQVNGGGGAHSFFSSLRLMDFFTPDHSFFLKYHSLNTLEVHCLA